MTDARHLPLMLALTFATGVVDAVGYLGLDRVFTGNMTGNVVVLGMALAGGNGLPVAGPLVALACFMGGAALAGRTLRDAPTGWTLRCSVLLGTNACALAATALVMFADPTPPHTLDLVITGVLGLTMGAQAGTARQIAVREVTTVVVTSTITALAAESWFGNRAGAQLTRRGTAIALILLGACVGALVLRVSLGGAVSLAALAAGAVAVIGERDRRTAPQREGAGGPEFADTRI
ncbi:MAG: hypothetical protein JWR52_2381 [Marmoricola sp.]|nr:hypothetical protein [Marmoricola sp.]